jgi:hypothetical protein
MERGGGVHVEFYPLTWISEPLGSDSVPREKKVSHIGYLICGRHAKEIYVLNVGNSLKFIIVTIKEKHKWGRKAQKWRRNV